MKSEFISQNNSKRLILIYAGWAMDANPFKGLRRPGYDIAVVWDYRDFIMDWSFLGSYKEVCVIAWSLGVHVASRTFTAYQHLLTRSIAVNGTEHPVNGMLGIPPIIFAGTLSNLDERNLRKFYIRVCGGLSAYNKFAEHLPQRSVAELSAELRTFLDDFMLGAGMKMRWDFALISTEDAIFPPVNQWRAWRDIPVRFVEGSHMPDFQRIIDRYIIDKDFMTSRFNRGLSSYDTEASVQANVTGRVGRLLQGEIASHISRRGARVLEIGSGTGALSHIINNVCGCETYFEMWDIAGEVPITGDKRSFRRLDAETEIMRLPAKSFDAIFSASTIQWFNSPAQFLVECKRVVSPGGYVVLTAFVKGNLEKIVLATGLTLPLLTADEWRKIIPDGLEVKYMHTYNEELEFDSPIDLFKHLKKTGVDSLGRAEGGKTIGAIRNFGSDLDGKYRLCYKPIIIICKRND